MAENENIKMNQAIKAKDWFVQITANYHITTMLLFIPDKPKGEKSAFLLILGLFLQYHTLTANVERLLL